MSEFQQQSRAVPGGMLSRQMSTSHVQPRSLTGYQDFFRQNSNPENGWLSLKVGRTGEWDDRWVAFEDYTFSVYKSPGGAKLFDIPMDTVVSFRTDNNAAAGDECITINTTQNKIVLKAKLNEDTKRWLFCFQKCVALVLSHLIDNANAQYSGAGTGMHQRQDTNHLATIASVTQTDTSDPTSTTTAAAGGEGVASSMEREIRGIASGIGMSSDYSNFMTSKAENSVPFTRMESQNQPLGSARTLSTGDGTMGGAASFLEGLGLEEGNSAGRMPYTRVGSTKINSRRSLPVDYSLRGSVDAVEGGLEGDDQEQYVSSVSTKVSHARPGEEDDSNNGNDNGDDADSEASKYMIRLKGVLRPGESSNNLLAHKRDASEGVSSSAGSRQSPAQPQHMAASPAIPISYGLSSASRTISAEGHSSITTELLKVAGSYEDTGKTSVLAKAVNLLDEDENNSEDEDELEGFSEDNDSGDDDNADDDPDLMFGMDDSCDGQPIDAHLLSPPRAKSPKSGSHNNTSSGGKGGGQRRSKSGAVSPGSSLGSRGNNVAASSAEVAARSLRMSPATLLSSMAQTAEGGPVKHSLHWIAGACSRLGPRNSNEDRYVAVNSMSKAYNHQSPGTSPATGHNLGPSGTGSVVQSTGSVEDYGFFAVYDGHCGSQAAQFLQDNLHQRTCAHRSYPHDIETALEETCVGMDREFLDLCDEKKWYAGTTALGVVLTNNALVMFNIGDCVAVLGTAGGGVKVLNTPHKPGHPEEEKRIKRANGWITEERELYMGRLHRMDLSDPVVRDKAQQVTWVTIHRVCGELAVSRSIGDPDYKRFVPHEKVDALFNWPDDHNQSFAADLVIPDPEIVTHELSKNDEFFVIASDGLWDVVSPEDAADKIRVAFKAGRSPMDAAEDLSDLAIKLGSSDNVTVIIVRLGHGVAPTSASPS